jgi:hypothetical protein
MLAFEAVCNASVEKGATVTFSVYREGDESARLSLISAEVESIVNRHGWRAGYFFNGRQDGVFHWSISGT